jgi:hypothetical protein
MNQFLKLRESLLTSLVIKVLVETFWGTSPQVMDSTPESGENFFWSIYFILFVIVGVGCVELNFENTIV